MSAYLNALGVVCALGRGKAEVMRRLLDGDSSGMRPWPVPVAGRSLPVGAVTAELPSLPDAALRDATRNNRLLLAAVEEIESEIAEAVDHYGPARIGVVLGTKSGRASCREGVHR